jgi:hypothetical protein
MTAIKTPAERAADDPELMRLWGEINNAWDQIERLLYTAFDAMLIDVHPFQTQAIFYSQRSHAARRDMTQELAKGALMTKPDDFKALKKALKRVRGRSDDRNKLAHGLWGETVELPNGTPELSRIPLGSDPTNPPSAYTRKKLKRVRNEMLETAQALKAVVDPLDEEKRSQIRIVNERWFDRLAHGAVDVDNG